VVDVAAARALDREADVLGFRQFFLQSLQRIISTVYTNVIAFGPLCAQHGALD